MVMPFNSQWSQFLYLSKFFFPPLFKELLLSLIYFITFSCKVNYLHLYTGFVKFIGHKKYPNFTPIKYFVIAGLNNILHPICSAYLQYLYISNIIFINIIDKIKILIIAHF